MSRRPCVLNQLGSEAQQQITRAVGHLADVVDASEALPWALPAAWASGAEVLFTAPRNGWRTAPQTAPPGWPGQLQWVHLASAGIDFFPPWLLEVPRVTCSRGVAAAPIAEFVMAALLDQQKALPERRVAGALAWRETFEAVNREPLGSLQGQSLGLVGYGAIGQAIAVRANAFGMKVMALRRGGAIDDAGVTAAASLEALLAASDHVVLALPITPQTRHIINARSLAHARPGLHLVNIARGALVDQAALLQALDAGRLSRATLDVTEPEPLPQGHPLYLHPRVRLTPHISWSARHGLALTVNKFLDNFTRYAVGESLVDLIDASRGY